MQEEVTSFFSEGDTISGIWRTPDAASGEPLPTVVQGPGWLGLKDAALYRPYHEALTDAGFGVLIIDYRGFGESGGDKSLISPMHQVQDLVNAVAYLQTRNDVRYDQLGVFGSGATGGGNAVVLAALDDRVRCVVAQVPIADGRDWLRRMRDDRGWTDFLARLDDDRKRRVSSGNGTLVHPREEIMVASDERRSTTVKSDVDGRVPPMVSLASADRILAYRPIDFVHRITPRGLLVVAVEDDPVTPTDHAVQLYERAGAPKRMIMQLDTTHYAAYERYGPQVIPQIVDWFRAHLTNEPLSALSAVDGIEVTEEITLSGISS
jgi:dipeptidyl aminopeptidase/acylaminoacyl peptidase